MRLVILLCFASGAWCGSSRQELTVWIYDYAPIPLETLDKALLKSQEIFLKAGVIVKWLKCRPFIEDQCVPPLQSTDVLLKVISETTNQRMQKSGTFGSALRMNGTGLVTYVFYNPVEYTARQAAAPVAVLLGMVITHELGHFFGLEHRFRGIMMSGFEETQMWEASCGVLTFDMLQAEQLRAAIASRLRQLEMTK
jgi:hypothetical protein